MDRDISPSDDIIDSRDIIARAEALREVAEADPEGELFSSLSPQDVEDAREELDDLTALLEDIKSSTGEDPADGVTLINEDYFEEYAEELASDIGAIPRDAGWPTQFIDWGRAADALKMDYSLVTWRDTDFWVR